MKSTKKVAGLTYQDGKGYKKCIGFYDHADGRRLPKIHWLGHDEKRALYLASVLQQSWLGMQYKGPRGWTPEDIAQAKANAGIGIEMIHDALKRADDRKREIEAHRESIIENASIFMGSPAAPQATPEPAAAAPGGKATLYGAMQAYIDTMNGKPLSDSHKTRIAQVLNVDLKKNRADCPLADVDYIWIDQLCDHFKSRPKTHRKAGKVISAGTVAIILRYLRAFFVWLDDTGYGGWTGPRKLTKPFRVRQDDLMTPAEKRESTVIQQFDVATLKKLYHTANDFQRSVMLTALFCGLTQQELAVLTKDEFDLDNNALHHFRNKTGIEGRFWLPDELVKLLRKPFRTGRKDDLVFRSSEGNPLIVFKGNRQTSDTVRQFWDDLRVDAELPNALSFKYLRKYLADYCTRHGGEEMGQVAMAHSQQTVLGKNYTSARDFAKFQKLQKKMHAELKKAGMFTVPAAKRKAA